MEPMMEVFLPIFLITLLLEIVIIAHLLRKKWPAAPYVALPLALVVIFVAAIVSATLWALAAFFIGLFAFVVFGIMWYIDPVKAKKTYKSKKKKARRELLE